MSVLGAGARPRGARPFMVVVGLVVSAGVITWITRRVAEETMFVFFVAAVAVATWWDGWVSGTAASVLCILAVDYFFTPPVGSLFLVNPALIARIASFALVACLIIVLTDALRRAQRRAEELAAEAVVARNAANDARAHAEHVSGARGRFLAALSHEVRTPVNALLGYADLLETGAGGPLSPDQSEYVTRLRTAGRHLLTVVNDVLDIAKVDAGRLDVAMAAEPVEDAVRTATTLVLPQATKKRIQLDVEPSPRPVDYCGDRDRVRQILVNLLSNAIKFTPPDGSIIVAWGADGSDGTGGVWITVKDTGPGVAQDDRERIFEPFEQANTGGAPGTVGTGLGLAISRRLARRMGGDLRVAESGAHGSTFLLTLGGAA